MRKTLVGIGLTIGSIIGGYIPALWGASLFSYSSMIGNGIGAIVGIYITYKLTESFD
ncbi:MAG TPA: hypothetical protein VMR41_05065 [Patescibacteria group bacterium]|nr:hypothetical protein [Patescibacteria group bacterium]